MTHRPCGGPEPLTVPVDINSTTQPIQLLAVAQQFQFATPPIWILFGLPQTWQHAAAYERWASSFVQSLFDVARQQLANDEPCSCASGLPPGYPRVWRGSCTYGAVRPLNLLVHWRSRGSRSGALRAAPFAGWYLTSITKIVVSSSYMRQMYSQLDKAYRK